MSFGGLAAGALLLLGVGVAAVHYVPQLWASAKNAITGFFGSLGSSARAVLAAPGEALGYLQTSADYSRNPDRDAQGTDVLTGAKYSGPLVEGKTIGTLQREQAAAEAAKRAAEPKSAAIQRLTTQKALLEATGQPYFVDTDAGEKLTLADVNARLAALNAPDYRPIALTERPA